MYFGDTRTKTVGQFILMSDEFLFICFYVCFIGHKKRLKIPPTSFYSWMRWKSWCINKRKMPESATETELGNKSRHTGEMTNGGR